MSFLASITNNSSLQSNLKATVTNTKRLLIANDEVNMILDVSTQPSVDEKWALYEKVENKLCTRGINSLYFSRQIHIF